MLHALYEHFENVQRYLLGIGKSWSRSAGLLTHLLAVGPEHRLLGRVDQDVGPQREQRAMGLLRGPAVELLGSRQENTVHRVIMYAVALIVC